MMRSEEAWVANVGMEGTNGATCGLSMGIDGPGGMVDGVGGEVNDASSADEMGGQFLHVLVEVKKRSYYYIRS